MLRSVYRFMHFIGCVACFVVLMGCVRAQPPYVPMANIQTYTPPPQAHAPLQFVEDASVSSIRAGSIVIAEYCYVFTPNGEAQQIIRLRKDADGNIYTPHMFIDSAQAKKLRHGFEDYLHQHAIDMTKENIFCITQ